MKRTFLIFLFKIALIPGMAHGQNIISNNNLPCAPGDNSHSFIIKPDPNSNYIVTPVSCAKRLEIFEALVKLTGLHNRQIELVETTRTVAQYVKSDTIPYILYRYSDFYNQPDEAFAGVMCHELGHFVNHHEDLPTRPDLELDADYDIGFLMQKAGFDTTQAFSCLTLLEGEQGSLSHPGKRYRKASILNGYANAAGGAPLSSFANTNPRVIWNLDSVTVDGKAYSCKDGYCPWNKAGVFYEEATNSTYQFLEYPGKHYGLGRLVNNKTNVTYVRTGKTTFLIYQKGQVIDPIRCAYPDEEPGIGWTDDDIDYLVHCSDVDTPTRPYFLLKDFKFAPYGQLMPAILTRKPSEKSN